MPNLPGADFHLHPRYREDTAIDEAVRRVTPGIDGFKTEQQHERIAPILESWRASLLGSSTGIHVIEEAFSDRFSGTPWKPSGSSLARKPAGGLEVRRLRFEGVAQLDTSRFLEEMRISMGEFAQIITVEFQITKIEEAGELLATQIRYELVGTGAGFHRQQRVGQWRIEWEKDGWRVRRWLALGELRSEAAIPWFVDVTANAFAGNSSYKSQMVHGADYWRTVLDGASGIDIYGHNGISVGDLYGDGHDDIYVCQAAGLPNRLYRNRGDGSFEDITESSGVGALDNTACALIADFNNDGRQDLVVVRTSGPLLFINEGRGKFKLREDAFHFADPPQGTFTGAAAADYNLDGKLDIYFCLYSYYQGADQYKYPTPYFAAENGPPNFLMQNQGDGTFRDVTAECGLDQNNTRFSFCCGWADYNRDGWPDLYVVNDFGKKNLYRNNGNGTFTDVAHEAGVEDVGAGMSVCWSDFDNSGEQDLYVANMWTAAGERVTQDKDFQVNAPAQTQAMYRKHAMGNSLLRNRGGTFQDVTQKSETGVGRWAWSCDSWDFDHDGNIDIYLANGMISGVLKQDLNSFFWREVVAKSPNTAKSSAGYESGWNAINELVRSDYSWSGYERNILYANNGDGTFSDVSAVLGLDFIEDGRAFALADIDGDGRQELFLKNRSSPQLRLMKNILASLPPAISFRLTGTKSNRDAIGAAITIVTHRGRQTKMLQAGSGFLSQHSKEVFFGLGDATGEITAAIHWPSGLSQQLSGLTPNIRIWVTEGEDKLRKEAFGNADLQQHSSSASVGDVLPETTETWLLAPIAAPILPPKGKPTLLTFRDDKHDPDLSAVYNLLHRSVFDRHFDMPLPTSFLIDELGQIVKIYRGSVSKAKFEEDVKSIRAHDRGRLAKALPFQGVSSTYEFERNYLSLGSMFFQRGYMEPAGIYFRSALAKDPSSAEASYGLGSVYLKQGSNDEAKNLFEKATQMTASYPETRPNAWNNLGLLATREGDSAKAAKYFEQALQVDPDLFVALLNLGNVNRQQGRLDEAQANLEKALLLKPTEAEANYSLGMVFAQMDKSAKAYDYLQRALKSRPGYPEALNNLGVLYLRTRRRDEAVASFERCIEVAPEFEQAYLNLARVYAIEGNLEKARSVLQDLLSKRPNDTTAQKLLEQLH